jgi:rhodanese-related sulfurtransferase
MDIITIEELHNRIKTGEQINLIDVREPYEHEEFNIGGVLHPLGRIMSADVDDIEQLKDSEVIVYCRSGNRSGQAAMMLESMGFSKVKNLQGGMMAWRVQFPG